MSTTLQQQRTATRRQLRHARKQISPEQRRQAEMALSRQLLRQPALRYAKHIAAYSAVGSEIDPSPAVQQLARQGRRVYFPRLRGRHMDFLNMLGRQARNKHGIDEPQSGRTRPLWAMSVVLVPLLGFDLNGQRMGQGGGYYDRALSRLRFKRPRLIGLAFEQQRCEHIPAAAWDQPLDSVITPQHIYNFRT